MSNGSSGGNGSASSTFEVAVGELLRFVEPLVSAAEEGPAGIMALLDETGVSELLLDQELEKLVETINEEIGQPASELVAMVGGNFDIEPGDVVTILETASEFDPDDPDPKALLEAVRSIVEPVDSIITGVQTLSDLDFEHENINDAGERLLNYLVVRYLRKHRTETLGVLRLLNIVELPEGADPWAHGVFKPANIETVFTDPTKAVVEGTNWGQQEFRDQLIIDYLSMLLDLFGIPARIEPPVTAEQAEIFESPNVDDDFQKNLGSQLAVPVVITNQGAIGLRVVPVPDTGNYYPGLTLVPYGPFTSLGYEFEQQLAENWRFSAGLEADFERYGLFAQPSKQQNSTEITFRALDGNVGSMGVDEVQADASLEYDGTTESGDYRPIIGTADGTRLALGTVAAAAYARGEDGSLSMGVELPADGKLVIKPSGGFVSKVLPDEVTTDFTVKTGWSMADGLYFGGGATLEIPIPLHEKLGPIELKEVFLALGFDAETAQLTAVAAASAAVKLGPIVGTVDRIGVDVDVTFPEGMDGNLGPVNLELGFKPPRGAGLSIAAGSAAKGGGYLFYDDEKERYGGAAQIKVPSGLTLSAVGLITTELPDGSDGFSMFVMIAGEFSPVPIGAGFTLNGVGGLLGINRRFKKKALSDVIRKGNMQSVLFPKKVADNAQQIISDMRSMFPPKRGMHVFGPMVKIGYGSPTTVEFSIGVVLEIPSWRIAILGRMELGLPGLDVDKPDGLPDEAPWPQVKINLDVAGIIDIPGKKIKIDATIYDSWVLTWSVKGDMALRARWGEKSQFLLSIGGFHPAYEPPDNVPDLNRVTVALDLPGGTPQVTFKGYMAVTSNTFQVGAKVHAELEKGPIFVAGTLGFDALFQFSPFKFRFDFLVKFKFEVGSFKMGASVDGRISGPSPMRIRGKATLNPPGPGKVSGNFNLKLGEDNGASDLPDAAVLPAVLDAFEEPKNWEVALPQDGESPISLVGAGKKAQEQAKQGGGGSGQGEESPPVKAHPLGTLRVSQGTVPLEHEIEKFGEVKPGTYNKFEIASVRIGRTGSDEKTSPVSGEFAPAKYKPMDSTEKLNTPDFVEKTAGTTVGSTGVYAGGGADSSNATAAQFIYEEQVYDREEDRRGDTPKGGKSNVVHSRHTAKRMVADRASSQTDSKDRFSVREPNSGSGESGDGGESDGSVNGVGGRFSVDLEDEYVVVDQRTFQRIDDLEERIAAAERVEIDLPDWAERDQLDAAGLPKDEAREIKRRLAELGYDQDTAVVSKQEFEEAVSSSNTDGAPLL